MLKILKAFGFCDHRWTTVREDKVPFSGNEGSIVSIDLAHAGTIKRVDFIQLCNHCGKLRVVKVNK